VKRNLLLCYFHACTIFWCKQLDHLRYKNTCCSRPSNWFLDHTSDSIYLTKEIDNYKYLKLIYIYIYILQWFRLHLTSSDRVQVLTVVTMKRMIAWVVMQHNLTSTNVLPKCQRTSNELHRVITQKIVLFRRKLLFGSSLCLNNTNYCLRLNTRR
jgi:hypothetical protein